MKRNTWWHFNFLHTKMCICNQRLFLSFSCSLHCIKSKGILRTEYYVNSELRSRLSYLVFSLLSLCGSLWWYWQAIMQFDLYPNPNTTWHKQEMPIEFRCENKMKKCTSERAHALTQRGIFLQINSLNKLFFIFFAFSQAIKICHRRLICKKNRITENCSTLSILS